MFYYQTFVSEISYRGAEPLTYASDVRLPVGAIVKVPLKNSLVIGAIYKQTTKPKFATKPIEHVFDLPPLPSQLLELGSWIPAYYPAGLGVIAQHFLPIKLSDSHQYEQVNSYGSLNNPPTTAPTDEQNKVLSAIDRPGTYLLHGETGSGKTRVYIELALKAFSAGRSTIILTPEISLTPQLAKNFQAVFGTDNVVITHSQLTEKERRTAWLRILNAQTPLIVIGPRSAIFSPLQNIGLIVMDEAHETSYKQDQSPYYHTSKLASRLAELHKAQLILGSATPSMTDYFLAEQRGKPILRMESIANTVHRHKTTVTVIDIKDRKNFNRSAYLSDQLIRAIESSLAAGEQSMLFLNRRGTARIVICQQCGWQAACPHCDLPLTYHGDTHSLRCHTCGYTAPTRSSCPQCKSSDIVLKSIGTKAISDEVQSIFPSARVQRFDTDNKKSERIEQHYDAIKNGEVDILIGTQVLAKGFDLPKLSVVGAVIADTSLYFPDFTAQERTYQLIRQVIGRVGRGHRSGTVFVQTYDPSNPTIIAAAAGNWKAFYESELQERKKFSFPPYCFLLKVFVRRATSKAASQNAQKLAETLAQSGLRIAIDGPSPCFHERINNKYQWQIIVKAKDRKELIKVIELLPTGWGYDIDPTNLL